MYQIDSMSRTPVYEQIIEQTKRFIITGVLNKGEQLESVRSVAFEHSINPRTILKAYNDLDAEGIIKAVPGKGYFVCDDANEILKKQSRSQLEMLSSVFSQMKTAGISRDEIISCVDRAYFDENSNNIKGDKKI